jgi:SAM-dependent methyltransferase
MSLNANALTQIRSILGTAGGTDEQLMGRVLRLAAMWRSQILANTVVAHYGAQVQNGPFAGMEYLPRAAEGALLPRLLGCYESELHPHLTALADEGLEQIIDVGCAEGFYAVGLARLMPHVTVHAFDIDPAARAACAELAALNEVSGRISIGETFNGDDFARFENSRTLVFMDIEGGERELLDPVRWPALRTLKIVVETHPGPSLAMTREIAARFAPSHDVIWVEQSGKDPVLPPMIKKLGHLDHLLAAWEWRVYPTPWLVMRPKG